MAYELTELLNATIECSGRSASDSMAIFNSLKTYLSNPPSLDGAPNKLQLARLIVLAIALDPNSAENESYLVQTATILAVHSEQHISEMMLLAIDHCLASSLGVNMLGKICRLICLILNQALNNKEFRIVSSKVFEDPCFESMLMEVITKSLPSDSTTSDMLLNNRIELWDILVEILLSKTAHQRMVDEKVLNFALFLENVINSSSTATPQFQLHLQNGPAKSLRLIFTVLDHIRNDGICHTQITVSIIKPLSTLSDGPTCRNEVQRVKEYSKSIAKLLRIFKSNASIFSTLLKVTNSCELVKYHPEILIEASFGELLMEVLAQNIEDENIPLTVGKFLLSVYFSPRWEMFIFPFIRTSSCQLFVNVIRSHPLNASIAANYCRFLAYFASQDNRWAKITIKLPGVIRFLLDALKEHKDNNEAICNISLVLGMIPEEKSAIQELCAMGDSCEIIMQTLLLHVNSDGKISNDLCLLIESMFSNSSQSTLCVEKFLQVPNACTILIHSFQDPSRDWLSQVGKMIEDLINNHSNQRKIAGMFGSTPQCFVILVKCLQEWYKRSDFDKNGITIRRTFHLLGTLCKFREPFVQFCKVKGVCEFLVKYLIKVYATSDNGTAGVGMLISFICNRGYSLAPKLLTAVPGRDFGELIMEILKKYSALPAEDVNAAICLYMAAIFDVMVSVCNCKWRAEDNIVENSTSIVCPKTSRITCTPSTHVQLITFKSLKKVEELTSCLIILLMKYTDYAAIVLSALRTLSCLCSAYDQTDDSSVTRQLLGIGKLDWLQMFTAILTKHKNEPEIVSTIFYQFLSEGMLDRKVVPLQTQERALDIFLTILEMYKKSEEVGAAMPQVYDAISILIRGSPPLQMKALNQFEASGSEALAGGKFWQLMLQYLQDQISDSQLCGIFCNLFVTIPWGKHPMALMETVKKNSLLIPILIEILKKHKTNPTTIYCGAVATHTVMINIHLSLLFQKHFPQFCQLIYELMKIHIRPIPNQYCPIGELCEIIFRSCYQNPEYPDRYKAIPGLIELLAEILKVHHNSSPMVAGKVCAAISGLCLDDMQTMKKFQLIPGCCVSAMNVIRVYQQNVYAFTKACDLLIMFAMDNVGKQKLGQLANLCELLVNAVKIHGKDVEAVCRSCTMTKLLFSHPDNISKYDGLVGRWASYVDALELHKSNPKAVNEICELLCLFGQHLEAHKGKLQDELPEDYCTILIGLLYQERKEKTMVQILLQLMIFGEKLSLVSSNTNKVKKIKQQDIDVVIGVFKIYKKNAKVLQLCLTFLGKKAILQQVYTNSERILSLWKLIGPMVIEHTKPYIGSNIDLMHASCSFIGTLISIEPMGIKSEASQLTDNAFECWLLDVLKACQETNPSTLNGPLMVAQTIASACQIIISLCTKVPLEGKSNSQLITATNENTCAVVIANQFLKMPNFLDLLIKLLKLFKSNSSVVEDLFGVATVFLQSNTECQRQFLQKVPTAFDLFMELFQMHKNTLSVELLIALIDTLSQLSLLLPTTASASSDRNPSERWCQMLQELLQSSREEHKHPSLVKVIGDAMSVIMGTSMKPEERIKSMMELLKTQRSERNIVLSTIQSLQEILAAYNEKFDDFEALLLLILILLSNYFEDQDVVNKLMDLLMLVMPAVTDFAPLVATMNENSRRLRSQLVGNMEVFISLHGKYCEQVEKLAIDSSMPGVNHESLASKAKAYLAKLVQQILEINTSVQSMFNGSTSFESAILIVLDVMESTAFISDVENARFLCNLLLRCAYQLEILKNKTTTKMTIYERLMKILSHHCDAERVLELVCQCLDKICFNDSSEANDIITTSSEHERDLLTVLQRQGNNQEVVKVCLKLMNLRLAQENVLNTQDDGCTTFSNLLAYYSISESDNNADIVEMICEILISCLVNDTNQFQRQSVLALIDVTVQSLNSLSSHIEKESIQYNVKSLCTLMSSCFDYLNEQYGGVEQPEESCCSYAYQLLWKILEVSKDNMSLSIVLEVLIALQSIIRYSLVCVSGADPTVITTTLVLSVSKCQSVISLLDELGSGIVASLKKLKVTKTSPDRSSESVNTTVNVIIEICKLVKLLTTIACTFFEESSARWNADQGESTCVFEKNCRALGTTVIHATSETNRPKTVFVVVLELIQCISSTNSGIITRRRSNTDSVILESSKMDLLCQEACGVLATLTSKSATNRMLCRQHVEWFQILLQALYDHREHCNIVNVVACILNSLLSDISDIELETIKANSPSLRITLEKILRICQFHSSEVQQSMQRLHTRLIDKPQVVETVEPYDAIQSSKSTVDLLSLTSITAIIPSAEIAMDLPLDANVYKACWRRSSVAIKICRNNSESSDTASILRSEIEKLSLLRHPRLVSLLGCCVDVIEVRGGELVTTEGYGLVLEYMEKGKLRMMLDREHDSMSWLQRVTIAADICEGMRFLHESQVYHGQLQSENVLVDDQGRAKLINFGRSNGKIGEIDNVGKNSSSFSKVDDKEMADQKRADIYCFAVILWELITGQIPSEEKVTRRQKLMLEGFKLSECPSTIIACFNQCIDSCGVNFVEVNNTAVSNANASTVSSKNNKKKAKKQQKQQLQQQQQQAPVSVVENVEKPIPSFHELFDDLHSVLLRMTQRLAERDRYIPDGFLCPITQDVMKDPVILLDGHSYERKAILDWFKRSDRSPLTNESLSSDAMIENYSLKSAIEGFLATFHNK